MATVAAIFDDSVALEHAVSALNDAGLGDDIVDVSENRHADTAPENTETPDNEGELGTAPVVGTGLLGGAGAAGNSGAAPLVGAGVLSENDDPTGGYIDRLGDGAEPFRLAAQGGGKLIFLETSDVDTAVSTLQQAGAQEIYDPR